MPGKKLNPAAAADKNLAALGQKLAGREPSERDAGVRRMPAPRRRACRRSTRVAGQYAEYIAAQLKAFKEGARANDPNGMMRGVTARMTEREMGRRIRRRAALGNTRLGGSVLIRAALPRLDDRGEKPMKHALLAAASRSASASRATRFAQVKPDVLVKQRQAVNDPQGKYFGPIAGMASGKVRPTTPTSLRAAPRTWRTSRRCPGTGSTRAPRARRAARCLRSGSRRPSSTSYAQRLQAETAKLGQAARAKDEAGVKQQYQAVQELRRLPRDFRRSSRSDVPGKPRDRGAFAFSRRRLCFAQGDPSAASTCRRRAAASAAIPRKRRKRRPMPAGAR